VLTKKKTIDPEGDQSQFKLNTDVYIREKIEEFNEKSLEDLNLENLSIEDKHICLLTQVIRFSNNLKNLSLGNNLITNVGV